MFYKDINIYNLILGPVFAMMDLIINQVTHFTKQCIYTIFEVLHYGIHPTSLKICEIIKFGLIWII